VKAVIFLGPSLPIAEARKILDAIYLPPARQADLLSTAINYRPDVIGLIDGVFMQSLSVWHKEILYALDQGIQVYGASSMGALRAAETAAFGMIGVGEIYRMYAEGELIDDDEVALAHAAEEEGYLKCSEPMVNVRATFHAAMKAGVLSSEACEQLTIIAKSIYFVERTFSAIFSNAVAGGMHENDLKRLAPFVSDNYIDVKAQDAIRLLEIIRDLPDQVSKPVRTFSFARTSHFDTLYNRDRIIQHNNVALPLEAVANYVALHSMDFHDLNFNALNRALVIAMAHLLEITVGEKEIDAEIQRFQARNKLDSDEKLASWLGSNDLSSEEFKKLMEEVALCRKLHRWLLIARWMERSTKLVLDQLRLENRYSEWVDKAASQERFLQASNGAFNHMDPLAISTKNLLDDHQRLTDFQMDVNASVWAEEAGFHTDGNLKMELLRSKVARESLLKLVAQLVLDVAEEHKEGVPFSIGSDMNISEEHG
jgi:hypothetical protein